MLLVCRKCKTENRAKAVYCKLCGQAIKRELSYGLENIIGRDDIQAQASSGIPRKSIAELTNQLDSSLPSLLIDHQPYKLEEPSNAGIDFQFSGHTHNGQFWPLNYITGIIFEQDWGYLKKKDSHFYISSG